MQIWPQGKKKWSLGRSDLDCNATLRKVPKNFPWKEFIFTTDRLALVSLLWPQEQRGKYGPGSFVLLTVGYLRASSHGYYTAFFLFLALIKTQNQPRLPFLECEKYLDQGQVSSCWHLFCPMTDLCSVRTNISRSWWWRYLGGEGSVQVSKCRKMELLIDYTVALP